MECSICKTITEGKNNVCEHCGSLLTDEKQSARTAQQYFFIGVLLGDNGNLKDAINYLHKSISIDNTNAEAMSALGTSYGKLGNYKLAIDFTKKAIAVNPIDAKPYVSLASYYLITGEYLLSKDILQKALSINPGFSLAKILLKEMEKTCSN